MKSPCRADHHIATAPSEYASIRIRITASLALGRQSRFAAQLRCALGALAGMRICAFIQMGTFLGFDATTERHAGHAVGSDGDDLGPTHETAVNAVNFQCAACCLARHRRPVTSQARRTNEMMLGEKVVRGFVGGSYVDHRLTLLMAAPELSEPMERLNYWNGFQ